MESIITLQKNGFIPIIIDIDIITFIPFQESVFLKQSA
jgi:hypothetical protein